MTALMLVCGFAGKPALTADIAIVQGSTLALFYAFSANARNVIFADTSGSAANLLLRARLFLLVPLAGFSFVLSSVVGSVDVSLALILILRRGSEWVGEIYLSSYEVQGLKRPTIIAIGAECLSFVAAVGLIFMIGINPVAAMFFWALAPLVAAVGGRLAGPSISLNFSQNLTKLAPNLGSTTIIGIAVYVFRLSIILLIGRVAAGDLFTAFAIGGVLPTVYNSSIGPSLALRGHREGSRKKDFGSMPWLVAGLFVLGGAVVVFSWYWPDGATLLRKSTYFWTSVGLSFSGGAIMMFALTLRIRMLQKERNVEIFGADVLSNVLIVVAVPYFYYLLGGRSLEALYLFNALLTLCFYWSAQRISGPGGVSKPLERVKLFIIAGLVIFPFFFQLGAGVFRDSAFIFDTGRLLKQLPIPLSVIALVAGVLLLGRFRDAHRSLTVFFFTALLLVLTSLMVQEPEARGPRLILMAQYLLPVLGLVLGEMYGSASEGKEFEKVCLVVVCMIVPAQLLCSWFQGLTILSPYLYLFSIYQHLHYVAIIMILAYGMALASLWDRGRGWRLALIALLPWVTLYVAASYSIEAGVVFVGFLICVLWLLKPPLVSRRVAACLFGTVLVTGLFYGAVTKASIGSGLQFFSETKVQTSLSQSPIAGGSWARSRPELSASSSGNLAQRLETWRFYMPGVLTSVRDFFLGHSNPPDRCVHPSGQNYYIDLVYNFGFAAVAPLLFLLAYTARIAWGCGRSILADPTLFGTVLAVFFVFGVDNFLKVGLRQPYPGIFGFFLLGLLLGQLRRRSTDANPEAMNHI